MIPLFFFFNDTATTEIYTLSLHDALPIFLLILFLNVKKPNRIVLILKTLHTPLLDRKSTRLNSSHANISYAVFCLKKKNTDSSTRRPRPIDNTITIHEPVKHSTILYSARA